jgi:hypothetical protein
MGTGRRSHVTLLKKSFLTFVKPLLKGKSDGFALTWEKVLEFVYLS